MRGKGCEEKGCEEDVAEWEGVEGKARRDGGESGAMRASKGVQATRKGSAKVERGDDLVMEMRGRSSDGRRGSRERPWGGRGDSLGKAGYSVHGHLFGRMGQIVAMAEEERLRVGRLRWGIRGQVKQRSRAERQAPIVVAEGVVRIAAGKGYNGIRVGEALNFGPYSEGGGFGKRASMGAYRSRAEDRR